MAYGWTFDVFLVSDVPLNSTVLWNLVTIFGFSVLVTPKLNEKCHQIEVLPFIRLKIN